MILFDLFDFVCHEDWTRSVSEARKKLKNYNSSCPKQLQILGGTWPLYAQVILHTSIYFYIILHIYIYRYIIFM